jgi:hypothetical protein
VPTIQGQQKQQRQQALNSQFVCKKLQPNSQYGRKKLGTQSTCHLREPINYKPMLGSSHKLGVFVCFSNFVVSKVWQISPIFQVNTMHKLKNVNGCKKNSNNNDWLKAIRKTKKKRQGETQDSIKFGVNLSFTPRLSPVYFFHRVLENLTHFMANKKVLLLLGFPYFAVTTSSLLGPAPTRRGTIIALDPTFGSFTLFKLVPH